MIYYSLIILSIVSLIILFIQADIKWYKALIPWYNQYILCKDIALCSDTISSVYSMVSLVISSLLFVLLYMAQGMLSLMAVNIQEISLAFIYTSIAYSLLTFIILALLIVLIVLRIKFALSIVNEFSMNRLFAILVFFFGSIMNFVFAYKLYKAKK